MNVHLPDEPSVDVNRRQAVGIALIEVKQLSSPAMQKYFGDDPFAGVFDHSIASMIKEPTCDGARKSHNDVLRLM